MHPTKQSPHMGYDFKYLAQKPNQFFIFLQHSIYCDRRANIGEWIAQQKTHYLPSCIRIWHAWFTCMIEKLIWSLMDDWWCVGEHVTTCNRFERDKTWGPKIEINGSNDQTEAFNLIEGMTVWRTSPIWYRPFALCLSERNINAFIRKS